MDKKQCSLPSGSKRYEGAQWLSGRVLDSRPKGRGFEPHRRHCVVSLSKNINPSLVLVQPRKTRPFITERLLMGRKESNQTNKLNVMIGVGKSFESIKSGCTFLPALPYKDHEETDTRMFAHAAYCVQTYDCNVVILQATDPDIFFNAMYYCVRIP